MVAGSCGQTWLVLGADTHHLFDGMSQREKAMEASSAAGVDNIDDLPDEVLEHVLSFLPSRDAVRTCVLARRWRHLWKAVTAITRMIMWLTNASCNREVKYADSWIRYAVIVRVLRVLVTSECEPLLEISTPLVSQHLRTLQLRSSDLRFVELDNRAVDVPSWRTMR
uniref:F-box domain-containing protein n=1 Tax=Leersia perrieri TaxID=77586 RepID=A0A0D9XQ55_9ORYZ